MKPVTRAMEERAACASVKGKAGSSLICNLQCGGVLGRADNLSHALQPAHFSRSACHGDEVGDQGHGKVPAARIRHAHQQLACGCGRQGWLLCAEGRLGANLQSKSITQRRAPKGPCLRAPMWTSAAAGGKRTRQLHGACTHLICCR